MYGQPAKQNDYKQKHICILAAHWLRDYTRLIAQHGTGGALRVHKTLPRCCAVRVRPFHFRANRRSQTHSAEGKTERACSRYCFVLQKRSRLKERGGEAGGRVRRSVLGVVQKYAFHTYIIPIFCSVVVIVPARQTPSSQLIWQLLLHAAFHFVGHNNPTLKSLSSLRLLPHTARITGRALLKTQAALLPAKSS